MQAAQSGRRKGQTMKITMTDPITGAVMASDSIEAFRQDNRHDVEVLDALERIEAGAVRVTVGEAWLEGEFEAVTGAQLREAREALGWSRELLGRLASYSAAHINKLERAPDRRLGRAGLFLVLALRRGNRRDLWVDPPRALVDFWARRAL
jgi:hypothetical protein